MITQYSSDIQPYVLTANKIERNIAGLIAEEHKKSLLRSLNKSGLGIMGLGLGIIGLSYAVRGLTNFAVIGIILIVIGFLLQLITNFWRS